MWKTDLGQKQMFLAGSALATLPLEMMQMVSFLPLQKLPL
jgi:hypothetical protein